MELNTDVPTSTSPNQIRSPNGRERRAGLSPGATAMARVRLPALELGR